MNLEWMLNKIPHLRDSYFWKQLLN
jgi:hypothetical protein